MAYEDQDGPDSETMDEGMAEGDPNASAPKQADSDTFFLPPDFTSKYDCQPGDTITLKVVNIDKDGDKEVKIMDVQHGSGGGGMSMLEDLRASKNKIMPEPTSEA